MARVARQPDLRLLAPALVAWAITAATLQLTAGTRLLMSGAAGLGVVLLVLARSRWPARGRVGSALASSLAQLGLAFTALALLASGGHSLAREAGPVPALARQQAAVAVRATITSDPIVKHQPGRDSETVLLRMTVHRVLGRGARADVSTPVVVRADGRWTHVRWHEQVTASGRLGPVDPGDSAVASFRATGPPTRAAPAGGTAQGAERVRSSLRIAVTPLPADARGLLPALVIGDTSRTPDDLTEAMLATGMTHLSAVSGSNVAVVLAFALGVTRLLGLRRVLRPAFALIVLIGFVFLARPEPSVVRAAVMGGIGLMGLSQSRRAAGLPVLGGAIVMLLVFDPWLSRSFGFALSTLATLGLLLFVRPWGNAIGARLPKRIRSWGPALAIPVAAQAMCAPVIVLLQGSVSVVAIGANLMAAPLVAPATIAGVGAALVAVISTRLATLVSWVGALPTIGIAKVARAFAEVPGGTMPWPDGGRGAVLLAALTILVILTGRWLFHQVRAHPAIAFAAALLSLAAAAPTSLVLWPPDGWQLVSCDVGQGDAHVLATTPGHAVLVDTGPDPALVTGCLHRLDVHTLDAVILTHFHADHVDGLPGVLEGREVREVFITPIREPDYEAVHVARWAQARGIPVHEVQAGDYLRFPGITADVWWPARRIDAGSVPNNASVVLNVHVGRLHALLLGDVEREAGHQMLLALHRDPVMAREAASLDVVKTPHHGSANFDEQFMKEVRAPVGIISVGLGNDYGHPTQKHLDMLRRDGYATYRTDQRGDVAVIDRAGREEVTWRKR